jgi:PhzF family phenazine biosynthesis protein
MQIPLYQIDAFTSHPFGGNPAAVCPLERWLDDGTMQAIAAENNLSETAFFVPQGDDFHLRWFTPVREVDLCGHATLASAYVIFTRLAPMRQHVRFMSRFGLLEVTREADRLILDFPAVSTDLLDDAGAAAKALDHTPGELWRGDPAKLGIAMAVFANAGEVKALAPDLALVAALPSDGIIATAPGDAGSSVDFVSRYFAPAAGIPEDPVTGAIHCLLIPFWAKRLGKSRLFARQVSRRGGELWCEDRGARVGIGGQCVGVMEGAIAI